MNTINKEKARSAMLNKLAGIIPQKQKACCCTEFDKVAQEEAQLNKELAGKAMDFAEGKITQEDFLKAKNKVNLFERRKRRIDGLRAFVNEVLHTDYTDAELLEVFKGYMKV